MKNIQILDCTLRDGGRIINCAFQDDVIVGISYDLLKAGIDIIEVGFLRDAKMVKYNHNSTFFTSVNQIKELGICNEQGAMYVAFIDYDMYDFMKLEYCSGDGITGLRLGFTKKQFDDDRDNIEKCCKIVKEKGYRLFIQGVNTLAYSDRELLELIEMVNDLKPYSFGIVDTYGGMYLEDIVHFYNLIDHNLDSKICIDIHSHNNFQLSFAFSQEIIRLAGDNRKIILDATLNGMGKCAGNLNTELIVDFLNRKKYGGYDLDCILDAIDKYLSPLKKENEWGYSIPAFMAGIYKSHPNNIIYLTEKYRLNSKDIKYIISGIDEDKRQRYDYDNIHRVYQEYSSNRIDDENVILKLKEYLENQTVLLLAPGRSVVEYNDRIQEIISETSAKVISVNFIPSNVMCDFYFYANSIHWAKVERKVEVEKCIITSNIHYVPNGVNRVDYSSLIVDDSKLSDNSTMMLLNLMKKIGATRIYIAGFDGLKENEKNYASDSFIDSGHGLSIRETNEIIKKMYRDFKKRVEGSIRIEIITPSLYKEEVE